MNINLETVTVGLNFTPLQTVQNKSKPEGRAASCKLCVYTSLA